ncbi:MAG: hypothetical protein AAF423_00490 [Pseudomonadota bacterium]
MKNPIEKRINVLISRREKLTTEIAELIEKLSGLTFDENKRSANATRKRLDELRTEHDEIEGAIQEGERRLKLESEVKTQENLKQLQTDLKKSEAAMVKSASRVDAILRDLEAAWLDYSDRVERREDVSARLREPGTRRDRDVLTLKRELLSGMWTLTPKVSSIVGLAFIPGNRRRSIQEALARKGIGS